MELPLKSPATTLFFIQILVFCSKVAYTLVPDADQVARNLKVSEFDCGAMTENTLYALNQGYDNAMLHRRNWKLVKRKPFSILSTSEKSLTQQNVEYINARNGSVDITTTAALITL